MAGNLVNFDPLRDLASFEPLRNLEDFFRDFQMRPSLRDWEMAPRIRMDVLENDKAYIVKAEIPGVKKEDIQVSIERDQVSVSAETKSEQEEREGESLVRSERYYGRQYRSFTLPQEVDDTKAEAKYHDGMLELTLPKRPGAKTGKQLTVH